MSTTAAATTPAPARSALLAIATGAWRAVAFVWKWVFGAALCTLFVGSLAVVGWTQRLMQRAVLRSWWRRSALRETTSFEDYVRRTVRTSDPARWPNWFLAQRATWTVRGVPRTLSHSLWLNLKLGCQSALNSWIGTAPAWSLWIFSWYAGWNNSFHKGYEQAWVGPTTGIVGSLFFAFPVAPIMLITRPQEISVPFMAMVGRRRRNK